jgi:16S rRNA (adenine1518-N6/adenine1519-N6)-dimethyltransferase
MGQNFMIEPSLFHNLSEYASLGQNDVTLDVGAGLGFLTRFLASRCKRVLAVEADNSLVKALHAELADLLNIEIIKGNVLKVQVSKFNKVVSIPPYQISSRLLGWLFNRGFDLAVLIFQKEFAKRLVAPVGSEDYGWLTLLTYYYVACELLDEVPKSLFYPQPEVGSIIIRLSSKQPKPFALTDEVLFTKLAQSLFTQRNRKVRNAVLPFLKGIQGKTAETAIKKADLLPFHDQRVRELAPEDFGVLANAISN